MHRKPDDKCIVKLTSQKSYSQDPKTVMEIMPKKSNTLQDDIQRILGIYGPNQLNSLIEDAYELFQLYDVDEKDDWVEQFVGSENLREVRLARTAYLLSRIADHHADLLKKVSRGSKGFWLKAEKSHVSTQRRENG